MYILDGNVTTAIVDAIRSLMITFCSLIYKLIIFSFDVFEKIGAANDILSTDIIVNITNKISLILGLFMVFRLTFAFVQYLINPDTMNDKNNGAGSLITKFVVTVVLLGSTPYMFKLAFSLQNAINEDKIIPRIIMGYSPDESDNATMGGMLAQSTFFTFFRVNENVTCKDSDADLAIVTTDAIEEDLKTADFSLLSTFVNQKCNINGDSTKKDYIYEMDAGGFGCLVIGFAVLYIVFIFTIQLAARLFQLAYLQVIAPIPIMMYITPKGDEKLKKWGSQCLTTFLDYFLRTAIIYSVLYLIQQIISNIDSSSLSNIWQTGNNAESKGYILGVLIIGLLVFAKKVPNLIKEIFPSLGGAAGFDYGLNFKKQVVEPLKSAYNTPLGWGLKLGKAGAVGAIGAIDRKLYNTPKPKNKLQQKLDKLMPGRAEAKKNEFEAEKALKTRKEQYGFGKELFNKYGEDLPLEAFSASEYRTSYETVKKAKKDADKATFQLRSASDILTNARASGNKRAIEEAEELYERAYKNDRAAQGALTDAKEKHEKIKIKYEKDAKIENSHKYYKDTTSDIDFIDESLLKNTAINSEQQNNSANTQQQSGIITEEHFGSGPRTNENSSNASLDDQHRQLVERYENETDPQKKQEIRNQINEFERKH